ncbi:alanine racemase [Marinoscillum sp. MHG1-6]|uniref:alanine racemase n=1 Tax=Marinoscillum sp. MHG1-6 TaxID=2959627 RepID=UPI00280B435F|nr:alanine racemase [Marinoscillum sp. MHG1-6]
MSSVITLNRAALIENVKFLKHLYHEDIRISSVVKGNAYGHGLSSYIPIAESVGFDHFSVYCADEAKELIKVVQKPETEIMIMGHVDYSDLAWVIDNNISFFVFDFMRLELAIEAAQHLGKKALVHIELETGMNRTGFDEKDLTQLVETLKRNEEWVEFTGLCTHFAGAESISNYLRVQHQKKQYLHMSKVLEEMGLKPKMKHTCCSAASIRLPEMRLDMVRIGILQYGFWPSREIFIEYLKGRKVKIDPLKRLISWESKIMSIKHIEMGEFIGYGTTFLAQKDMKIAVVPIGYSHGFSRSLSNQGRVLVRGHRTAVLGIVNMNCITIDVTDIEDVAINDTVTLIGKDGEHEITVSSFSELSDQLNYELLTRLPSSIPRKVK